MGLTFRLGQLPTSLFTDASNNVGIGGSPSGTYKLEVTGTAKVSSTLLVSGAATFSSSVTATSALFNTSIIIGNVTSLTGSWGNLTSVLQLGNSSTDKGYISVNEISGDDDINVVRYAYFDNTNWKRIGGGNPSRYSQRNAEHIFQYASSGADNSTITWNNALCLSSNGNVGIGTSSPSSYGGYLNTTLQATGASGVNLDFKTSAGTREGVLLLASGTEFSLIAATAIPLTFRTTDVERMRITNDYTTCFGKTFYDNTTTGVSIADTKTTAIVSIVTDGGPSMLCNRKTSDGDLVIFRQDGATEGTISVSGSTVSYNGGHLARYTQIESNQRIEGLLKGTVMSNLDKMAEWINPETEQPYENEQLNCMKISDVEGDINVAGVFVNWDNDDEEFTNDMNIAMTGDMIIRIAQNLVVQRGQLLMSAGDGTAKPQEDDIIRSKTIAKVTSNHITCVYEDGSYCVPCVLMAC